MARPDAHRDDRRRSRWTPRRCELLARTAQGSMRDAIGLLDQLVPLTGGPITLAEARDRCSGIADPARGRLAVRRRARGPRGRGAPRADRALRGRRRAAARWCGPDGALPRPAGRGDRRGATPAPGRGCRACSTRCSTSTARSAATPSRASWSRRRWSGWRSSRRRRRPALAGAPDAGGPAPAPAPARRAGRLRRAVAAEAAGGPSRSPEPAPSREPAGGEPDRAAGRHRSRPGRRVLEELQSHVRAASSKQAGGRLRGRHRGRGLSATRVQHDDGAGEARRGRPAGAAHFGRRRPGSRSGCCR